jgi:hypothetical protein
MIIAALRERLEIAGAFIRAGVYSGYTRDDALAACEIEEGQRMAGDSPPNGGCG